LLALAIGIVAGAFAIQREPKETPAKIVAPAPPPRVFVPPSAPPPPAKTEAPKKAKAPAAKPKARKAPPTDKKPPPGFTDFEVNE
jgi:hypothetical protein